MSPSSLAMSLFILSIILSYIFKITLQMFPQSKLLNYIDFIFCQLKWAWNVVLFQSFFHSCSNYNYFTNSFEDAPHNHEHNELRVMRFKHDNLEESSVECAICLCKIEDGEEVRELNCDHFFHRACLDRWMNCGRMTCPLCRNHLIKPNTTFFELNHHQEVIHLDFSLGRSRDRCEWWLR
ncbi:hypothetical protein R3W88_013660 [Solanum pinnatisectum]|uniref:RING-type domain-containing protein n=1 Tax=Solanum pinnatisectum TaxID=50273 RepID=A0AAV9KQI6_9SOLN|nr:hypothetical protein R3W88_013660 [Solanum pinnatisectum]